MSDIVELERRITAAMERIGYGVSRLAPKSSIGAADFANPAHPSDSGQDTRQTAQILQLEAQLAEEKAVSAQLEERIRTLRDRAETGMRSDTTAEGMAAARNAAALEARHAALAEARSAADAAQDKFRARMADFEATIETLRQANADLSDTVARLRGAMETGVATPDLVNRAMKAELDALRATRAADRAELDAVIEDLMPLIEDAN